MMGLVAAVEVWQNITKKLSSSVTNLLQTCDTYYCGYLQHSTFRFISIDFQLNTDFPSKFYGVFFTVKSPLVLLRYRFFNKMLLKRKKHPSTFFSQNYRIK